MKIFILLFAFVLPFSAIANEQVIEKKKQINWSGSVFSWEAESIPVAINYLTQESLKSCPSGFEKLREYTTREEDKYFLHFVVRCLTPATPAATTPSESR